MHGSWYCMAECLERALRETLAQLQPAFRPKATQHRIPLGLLLLSRQQLTAAQLRIALDAQKSAGHGRIGEWLQSLGFATEQQVVAALARQWSCPVLRIHPAPLVSSRVPDIPTPLLDSFRMIPVDFVEATSTLHIAFGEGIDYSVLYAIERMLDCHTQACLCSQDVLRSSLAAISEQRRRTEIVFDRVADALEFARIIRSYATKVAASEIRIALCGSCIWVRLERTAPTALNLIFRIVPEDVERFSVSPPSASALPAS
ncbi:MAG: hypothetical protein LAO24_03175 [Acidobacteriia bacterium]|nr:hypothetical protein [Terriglobia bacterium]